MVKAVEEKTHAKLGPSGWSTWSACPGSIPLSEGIVDKSSEYAREGTAAHSLLEDCIEGDFNAEDLIGRQYDVEGQVFTVDQEMADAVNTALGWIGQVIDTQKGDILMAEQPVPIGHLTGEEGAEGTSDIIGIVDGGKRMVVMDYKHGKGVLVRAAIYPSEQYAAGGATPQINGQLAMYGLGAVEKFGLIHDDVEQITLAVMQPRLDWYDEVTISLEELYSFADEVREAAGRVALNQQVYAEGNDLDLYPGEKQCKFCKAKAICPALREHVSGALQTVSSAADFEDLSLPKKVASVTIDSSTDPEKLAEVMRAGKLIEELLKAVRGEVERRLHAGMPVPGYKLVEGKKGNRKWKDEVDIAKELTKSGRLSAADAFKKEPISPTQAEKLLKDRPKVWSKIAPLITQSDGKPSVAPADDPRPEWSPVSAVIEFEDLGAACDQVIEGVLIDDSNEVIDGPILGEPVDEIDLDDLMS